MKTMTLLPILVCGWFLVSGVSAAESSAVRPNFVFLLCDDLGYGDLGCYGSPIIKTPHLDQLAKDGIRLTNCYAAAPVCSPSRAGIITGRNPNRLGIRDWIPENSKIYLKKDEPSVARLLKQAGYATAHVGKWHLNGTLDGSEPTPGDHGFDYWFSTQNNALPSHHNPINFVRNGSPVGPLTGYSSALIVDEALNWLKTVPKDQPYCLFVWFHAPHEPVATPEEFTSLYPGYDDPTKPIYYGSVTMVDHEVGRVLKVLDARGQRENTLVTFTSDNGPETLKRYKNASHSHGSPGPLRGMKLHVYEGGYRVPGILRWPARIRPGQVVDEPVCGVDFLPTFCELAGASLPTGVAFDGASFLPALEGKPVRRSTPLYWEYDRALGPNKLSLREGAWKVLSDLKIEQVELYNLKDDISETRNLTAGEPDRTRGLIEKLKQKYQDVNQSADDSE